MRLLHFVRIIDYAKWLFSCSPKWATASFCIMLKDFENKKNFVKQFVLSLFKTNRFHVAVRLFSHRSQKKSKCGIKSRTSVTHSAITSCATFFLFSPSTVF